jgi:hypothetical protein
MSNFSLGEVVSAKVNGKNVIGVYAKYIPFEFGDYCILYLGSKLGTNLASEKVINPKSVVVEVSKVQKTVDTTPEAQNLKKGYNWLITKNHKFESDLNKLDQMKIKFESSNEKDSKKNPLYKYLDNPYGLRAQSVSLSESGRFFILRTDEKSKVKKMIEEVKKLGINSNTISTMAVQDKAYKYRYGIMVPV